MENINTFLSNLFPNDWIISADRLQAVRRPGCCRQADAFRLVRAMETRVSSNSRGSVGIGVGSIGVRVASIASISSVRVGTIGGVGKTISISTIESIRLSLSLPLGNMDDSSRVGDISASASISSSNSRDGGISESNSGQGGRGADLGVSGIHRGGMVSSNSGDSRSSSNGGDSRSSLNLGDSGGSHGHRLGDAAAVGEGLGARGPVGVGVGSMGSSIWVFSIGVSSIPMSSKSPDIAGPPGRAAVLGISLSLDEGNDGKTSNGLR